MLFSVFHIGCTIRHKHGQFKETAHASASSFLPQALQVCLIPLFVSAGTERGTIKLQWLTELLPTLTLLFSSHLLLINHPSLTLCSTLFIQPLDLELIQSVHP